MPANQVEGGIIPNGFSEQTVVFFDWDDTLLASTFLSSKGCRLDNSLDGMSPYELHQLHQLEVSVYQLLSRAMAMGRLVIITNAETGWVQMSSQKWLPSIYPLLSHIPIVSARSLYERDYPASPQVWKAEAFKSNLSGISNVLSFGDSLVERSAVLEASKAAGISNVKTVKFLPTPGIDPLRRQVELILSVLERLCSYEGNLDLMLTSSMVA